MTNLLILILLGTISRFMNVMKENKIKMSNYKCNCGRTKNANGNCDGSHNS